MTYRDVEPDQEPAGEARWRENNRRRQALGLDRMDWGDWLAQRQPLIDPPKESRTDA